MDVATLDVMNAFMQANMDDLVDMKIKGSMAELLVKINPKIYCKHLRTEKGKSVLYVPLQKALYGTMKAALLFWENLANALQEWGFETNPYGWYVANKEINRSQCTVVWHVDDFKTSHKDANIVTEIINKLQ
eukprot:4614075-Ditylum_brightwellii.AAC.1